MYGLIAELHETCYYCMECGWVLNDSPCAHFPGIPPLELPRGAEEL